MVVNCAGIPDCNIEVISPDLSEVHPTAPFRKIINVNVWGSINVAKYGALAMAHAEKEPEWPASLFYRAVSCVSPEIY